SLTVLFTHDTHDHFLPVPAETGGEYGGYTRLSTVLKNERETPAKTEKGDSFQYPTITVDAGDFSMGSLFQTIYSTDAPELRALGAMGYDVATLGNHEYDYRAAGLEGMLNAAVKSGDPLPKIVQANYKPKSEDTGVQKAWDNYPVTDYAIIERDGLKIALFGVLGVDADLCAPMSNMNFEPIAEAAARVVEEIETKEAPDFIICLSHAGTSPDPKKSEDEILAKAVPGIDLIISGHTHSVTDAPIQVDNTLIVSCGAYTENLGRITITKDVATGIVSPLEFRLIPIDENIKADEAIVALADSFKETVSSSYLANYGMSYDEVLTNSLYNFTPISKFGETQSDDGLGRLITQSYIYAVKEAEGAAYEPVDFAVVPAGVVRASFAEGDITVSDAFNVSSLGVGADGTPGYPLISVYLTGAELRDAFEVDASVTPIMSTAQLYGSGMTWTFNPHRMIFNKVTDCAQLLPDGSRVPIDDAKLYRVVTGLYSGQMLGAVNAQSFGILSVAPKDKAGNLITDFEAQIVHTKDGAEVKEWYALASFLKSKITVPPDFQGNIGVKIVAPSWNIVELLKSPNWVTLLVLGILLLLIALIVFIIYRIATRKKRKLRKAAKKAAKK
ncbi:MAG: bifunctional UDP-sugar hydrolase/5'-nucleotidase, partial [Oscillospiraceae bacterium]